MLHVSSHISTHWYLHSVMYAMQQQQHGMPSKQRDHIHGGTGALIKFNNTFLCLGAVLVHNYTYPTALDVGRQNTTHELLQYLKVYQLQEQDH